MVVTQIVVVTVMMKFTKMNQGILVKRIVGVTAIALVTLNVLVTVTVPVRAIRLLRADS